MAFNTKTHANPDTPRYRPGQAHGNSLNRQAFSSNISDFPIVRKLNL
jgi:hypothetical protein